MVDASAGQLRQSFARVVRCHDEGGCLVVEHVCRRRELTPPDHHPQRLDGGRSVWSPDRELGIIGEDGPRPDDHRPAVRPHGVDVRPRFRTGDPAGGAVARGTSTIQR